VIIVDAMLNFCYNLSKKQGETKMDNETIKKLNKMLKEGKEKEVNAILDNFSEKELLEIFKKLIRG
jgi:hypothetical protein